MDEFVSDYRQLVKIAREENPDLKVVVLGHSMGGGIVFAYGVQHSDDYDLMILSGPAIAAHEGVSKAKAIVGKAIGSILPNLPIEAINADHVSRDPEVVAAYKADPLVYRGKVPAGIGKALLVVSEKMHLLAPGITAPLLVVHGSEDSLIRPTLGRQLYEAAQEPKQFVLVEGGSHHNTNSVGQPAYRQALASLFRLQ